METILKRNSVFNSIFTSPGWSGRNRFNAVYFAAPIISTGAKAACPVSAYAIGATNKEFFDKWHGQTVAIAITGTKNYPAYQLIYAFPLRPANRHVVPEFGFSTYILGERCIEYFFLFSFFHICTGDQAQQVTRKINIAIEIKIVSFVVWPCL